MRLPIAKESWPYLLILAVLTAVVWKISVWPAIIFLLLFCFVLFFFRDPYREAAEAWDLVFSPADGRILDVAQVYEERFFQEEVIKVSIFLALFNVHVNRAPVTGKVIFRDYRPGKYLPAFKSHASELNEKSFIGFETSKFKVLVTQVTGFVARRIVCRAQVGDRYRQGERFGLIKFGSCTETFLPLDAEILVAKGDQVRGGETAIARVHDPN